MSVEWVDKSKDGQTEPGAEDREGGGTGVLSSGSSQWSGSGSVCSGREGRNMFLERLRQTPAQSTSQDGPSQDLLYQAALLASIACPWVTSPS